MEGELSAESLTDNDSVCNDSPRREVIDHRIKCGNKEALDRLLKITVDRITNLTQSQNMGEYSSQFMSTLTEHFLQIMQDNLVVCGLPWNPEPNTEMAEPNSQMAEQKRSQMTALTQKLEKVAAKRKQTPRAIRKTFTLQTRHQAWRLKAGQIEHAPASPKVNVIPDISEEYAQACRSLGAAQKKLRLDLEEVSQFEKIESRVQDIVKRNAPLRSLNDTGYLTE